MPDEIFDNPRLAEIYDSFDGERIDLYPYLEIAKEFKAKSVLDIGCGTGSFSCLLAREGFEVIGVDPAQASLNVANSKSGSDKVRWFLGGASILPSFKTDLVVMTGNVAQVFLEDEDWIQTLKEIHNRLHITGHLVFEIRNPQKQAWKNWTPENTYQRLKIENVGFVKGWCELKDVRGELVSFRWTYVFESDGSVLTSDSTIRFRSLKETKEILEKTGFVIVEVRDAPDRSGQELVFIAKPKI